MKLPRDLDGNQLAQALSKFGYKIIRQTGNHIRLTTQQQGEHHITYRITIHAAEGAFSREATGTELLKEDKEIWLGEKPNQYPLKDDLGRVATESRDLAYGDPSSNAESMAFRRAAAKFGLGLYLYEKG